MGYFDGLPDLFGTGNKESESDAAAQQAIQDAKDAYGNLKAPNISLPDSIPYQNLSNIAGSEPVSYDLADPKLVTAAQAGPSSFEGVSADPRLQDAQMAALSSLQQIAEGGGLNDADKANLARIQSQISQESRGRNEAIMQNSQARGMAGGGMELLSKLQNSQDATNRESQQGLDIAGMAQSRALQALSQGGSLAGNMRGQQFSEDASKAEARDAIAKFNAGLSQQGNLANQGAANAFGQARAQGNFNAASDNANRGLDVQKFRANAAQNTSNLNTETSNNLNTARAQLPEQAFKDNAQIAQGKTSTLGPETNYYTGMGDRAAKKGSDQMANLIKAGAIVAML